MCQQCLPSSYWVSDRRAASAPKTMDIPENFNCAAFHVSQVQDCCLKKYLNAGIYMSAKGVMAISRKVEHPLHIIW